MEHKILFVDDELSILQGYQRILYKSFPVSTASSGEQGLATIQSVGPFSVVISDMRMPGMNGAEFLAKVRERAPDTVRMLLTGHSDMNAAIEAVNEGNIFRYLTKPCEKDVLVKAIERGVAQYQSIAANSELVKKARLISHSNLDWEAQDIYQEDEFIRSEGVPGPSEAREYLKAIFSDQHLSLIHI